jgi:hypothetical protein
MALDIGTDNTMVNEVARTWRRSLQVENEVCGTFCTGSFTIQVAATTVSLLLLKDG